MYTNNKRRKNNNSFKKKPSNSNRRSSNRNRVSSLDPERLVSEARQNANPVFQASRKFSAMPLDAALQQALENKGFHTPSEIQERTFDALLEGKDVLGIAQTGTGKTGAFLIPMIQSLLENPQFNHGLILVPTRELATQVSAEFKSMTKGMRLFSACFIGGTNIRKDMSVLSRKQHVIIATPGRLLDLIKRNLLNLSGFKTLVLDEFDRMLDMGFINDVKRVIKMMHRRDQTMLFSATLDKSQQDLIDEILINPVLVKVSNGKSTGENVNQDIIKVPQGIDKLNLLCDLLIQDEFKRVILFEETKWKVNKLTAQLNKRGIEAQEIHGNKSQSARQKALNAFKNGKIQVLVATDVAARGIDVDDVSHVINYQVPQNYDSYIHRIGRTGRAGKAGQAYTFVQA